MYESVAKLPCGEVTVAKLPCGEVTGNQFSMCLTKFFFLCVKSQKRFSRFFKKREQFTHSTVGLNTTKRDFLNCNKTLSMP